MKVNFAMILAKLVAIVTMTTRNIHLEYTILQSRDVFLHVESALISFHLHGLYQSEVVNISWQSYIFWHILAVLLLCPRIYQKLK